MSHEAINAAQLDYWKQVVPFFGGDESAQRAFAQYLVDGDIFDLPTEWGTDTWSLIKAFGDEHMMHMLLLARMVESGASVKPKFWAPLARRIGGK